MNQRTIGILILLHSSRGHRTGRCTPIGPMAMVWCRMLAESCTD